MFDLKPRPGQIGVLYWTEHTRTVLRLEDNDRGDVAIYPYDVTTFTNDFAAISTMQAEKVGSRVSLVLQVLVVGEKATQDKGDPYLTVHGVDMDGVFHWSASYVALRRG